MLRKPVIDYLGKLASTAFILLLILTGLSMSLWSQTTADTLSECAFYALIIAIVLSYVAYRRFTPSEP